MGEGRHGDQRRGGRVTSLRGRLAWLGALAILGLVGACGSVSTGISHPGDSGAEDTAVATDTGSGGDAPIQPVDAGADAPRSDALPDAPTPVDGGGGEVGAGATWDSTTALWDQARWN